MILEIQHETRFEYSEATIESLTELRMEPVSDPLQSCHSYHLGVTPPTADSACAAASRLKRTDRGLVG